MLLPSYSAGTEEDFQVTRGRSHGVDQKRQTNGPQYEGLLYFYALGL